MDREHTLACTGVQKTSLAGCGLTNHVLLILTGILENQTMLEEVRIAYTCVLSHMDMNGMTFHAIMSTTSPTFAKPAVSQEALFYILHLCNLKPGPNAHNISAQHIPTLLPRHLQAPVKRSQLFRTTYHNIVGRNMLRAFGHAVATCCDVWVLKIEPVRMPGCNIVAQIWPNDYNIMQHPQVLHEKFDNFQI